MPKTSGFTLVELLVVIAIIGILAGIGLSTFTSSQAKSRDAKRKADLQQIGSALELYYNDYGQYPAPDANGNIMGCTDGLSQCSWGSMAFSNSKTIYMSKLPADPMSQYNYYYNAIQVSGLYTSYTLYAHLENSQDKNLLKSILYSTQCGGGVTECNYGISSANTTP